MGLTKKDIIKYKREKRSLYKEFEGSFCLDKTPTLLSVCIDSISSAKNKIKAFEINKEKKYVWFLEGKEKREKKKYVLQVGEVEGTRLENEINSALDYMEGSSYYSIPKISEEVILIKKDTTFYRNAYWISDYNEIKDDNHSRKFLYKFIRDNYVELHLHILDIDKYLNLSDELYFQNDVMKSMIQMTKSYYAESKFAFETQAVFWNVYNSGVGYKALEEERKKHKSELNREMKHGER